MNAFAVTLLLCFVASAAKFLATGTSIDWVGPKGRGGMVIAALVIGFFVLRNVPLKPFTYLAPISLQEWTRKG